MSKLLIIPILIVLGLTIFPLSIDHISPPEQETPSPEIRLFFVGDIMLDRGVAFYMQENQDWFWPFRRIADFLRKADLVFGNLESMISDKGTNVGSIYSFRADPAVIPGLKFAGFDIVSVANNHSFDYTRSAFEDTLHRLTESGINYVGGGFSDPESRSPVIKTIAETKIAFLGYSSVGSSSWQATSETPGIAWLDIEEIERFKQDIYSAQEKSDILIVSIHFGEEYQFEPSPSQRILAETAIEAGADLVVGHHPHVLQPLEQYHQGWIAYSLGNFIFDQYFSSETMKSAILEVTVQDKNITNLNLIPVALTEEYQVYLSN